MPPAKVHFTVQAWPYGFGFAASLQSDIQPELIGLLDYNTSYRSTRAGLAQWGQPQAGSGPVGLGLLEAGVAEKLSLDCYQGYDATLKPRRFFHRWMRMLELVPS